MLSLVVWLLVCFAAAAFGSRYMPGAWYQALQKPSWNPPNGIFAPVWTVLYVLMAVAAWRVWNSTSSPMRKIAVVLFLVQLVLNALWTWVFFGLRSPGAALAEIAALWVAIAVTMLVLRRVDGLAASLLVPYLVWVSFASALNFAIWRLNT